MLTVRFETQKSQGKCTLHITFPCILLKTKHNKSPDNKENAESIVLLLKFSHRIRNYPCTPGFFINYYIEISCIKFGI